MISPPDSNLDAIALWGNGQTLSYLQLQEQTSRLAHQLNFFTDQPVIALLTDNDWLTFLFVHACAQINKPLFPLSPDLSGRRLQLLLQQSGCNRLMTDQKSLVLSPSIKIVDIETVLSRQHEGKNIERIEPDKNAIRLIVATSGSAGDPKGVMLSADTIAASARAVNKALDFHSVDCWLNCLPLVHIGGLSIIYRCAYQGASMVLSSRFNAQQVWDELHQYSVTHISLVPAMLSRLLDVSNDIRPPSGLRVVLIGGAALSPVLARRAHLAGWPLVVSYGLTETASICAFDTSTDAGMVAGRVGLPLDGFQLSASGHQKKLRVCGPALMRGYANPELLPGHGLQSGCFVTGDIGRLDEDGVLYITGRADAILVSAGKTIHPREIEEQLEVYTGAGHIAVTALTDAVWGDKLVAVFEAGDFDVAGLESWTRRQLASAICPRLFVQVDELPMTQTGKIDRKRLREIVSLSGQNG